MRGIRIILSGSAPGDGGTGQMIAFMLSRFARATGRQRPIVLWPPPRITGIRTRLRARRIASLFDDLKAWIRGVAGFPLGYVAARLFKVRHLTLIHPQTLGFKTVLRLLSARSTPAELLLMDSSFFCVRSYNYLPGERGPCLRCLGGRTEEGRALGCTPFPVDDPTAWRYVRELQELVRSGAVEVLAQTAGQAELARRHFDLAEAPRIVGVWTGDLEAVAAQAAHGSADQRNPLERCWDVVFHGADLPAKGPGWLLEVARECPDLRFLFPFLCRVVGPVPPNCEFRAMSWDTGLRAAVESSACTVVPSLWSAPIEAALMKSLRCARLVAVVENETAFQHELPAQMVLRLPSAPAAAARALDAAVRRAGSAAHSDAQERARELLSAVRDRFVQGFVR